LNEVLTIISITYHVLKILLQRPFLDHNHLSKNFQDNERAASELLCIDAAFAIRRLVESYKTAFTLRRAPCIISYSVYSAVVAILNQKLVERSSLTECTSFFWSALTDLRNGCNFGLQKPLDILRGMLMQFSEDILQKTSNIELGALDFTDLEKVAEWVKGNMAGVSESQVGPDSHRSQTNAQEVDSFPPWESSAFSVGMEGGDWPLNDTLCGLFMPS
jgi:hypothetical protein